MHFSPVPRWLDPRGGREHDHTLSPPVRTSTRKRAAQAHARNRIGPPAWPSDGSMARGMRQSTGDAASGDEIPQRRSRDGGRRRISRLSATAGAAPKALKDNVREEIQDTWASKRAIRLCRIWLCSPLQDFAAFYGTFVTGAGWVVPKRYVERVARRHCRPARGLPSGGARLRRLAGCCRSRCGSGRSSSPRSGRPSGA